MSGIVSGVDYSLLFSPGSVSSSDAADAILNTLYGGNSSVAGPSAFVSTGNPLLDLKIAQQDQTTDTAQEALQPQVQQAVAAFKAAVANATSIQSALANPDVQQVLLTANGLSDLIGQTALVQKALLSDPSDPQSLVNQLGNSTLLATAQSYDFAQNGLAALQNPQVISTLTGAYAEVLWRQSLDQATPGLSDALDFLSQASSITSVDDVLTNLTNFDVVTTALGISQDIVNQPLEAQQSAIAARLDISKLQDPNYVTSLTDQYLLTMQASNQSSAGGDITSLAVQASSLVV